MRGARRLYFLFISRYRLTGPAAEAAGVDLCEVRREEEVALVGPRTTGPEKVLVVEFGLCGRT